MEPIESKQFDGGFTVSIYYDHDAADPCTRDWSEEEMGTEGFKTAFQQWLNGEVYGFITTCEGVVIDSCWEFYSFEEAYSRAKENFPTRDDQYYFDRYENQ